MLPPGGEGQVQVTLRPKGTHVAIEKKVVVFSNDPEQPRFPLTMKGTLLIDMIAQPPTVNIIDLPPGNAGQETFSVKRTDGSTASVASVRVEDGENFSVEAVETEPGALATYAVHFRGRDEVGSSATTVVVETTGENTPELKIPVRASAAYNLRYPPRFGFTVREGRVSERTITLSTRRGDAPTIERVEDPDGLLDAEILPSRGPSTPIRLTLRADAVEKAGRGVPHTLVVHTTDPDEPRVEIEYSVMAPRTPLRAKPTAPRGTAPPGTVAPQGRGR